MGLRPLSAAAIEKRNVSAISRAPSDRTIVRLMTNGRNRHFKAETVTVALIESGV